MPASPRFEWFSRVVCIATFAGCIFDTHYCVAAVVSACIGSWALRDQWDMTMRGQKERRGEERAAGVWFRSG